MKRNDAFVVRALFCCPGSLGGEDVAQAWAKAFYKSDAWQHCRRGYIAERKRVDGGLCETCQQRLGYIVHHKIILTRSNIQDPEISLNWKHLAYECKLCHDLHEGHGVKRAVLPVCEFDLDGNPVKIRPEFERNRL